MQMQMTVHAKRDQVLLGVVAAQDAWREVMDFREAGGQAAPGLAPVRSEEFGGPLPVPLQL